MSIQFDYNFFQNTTGWKTKRHLSNILHTSFFHSVPDLKLELEPLSKSNAHYLVLSSIVLDSNHSMSKKLEYFDWIRKLSIRLRSLELLLGTVKESLTASGISGSSPLAALYV